VLIRAEAHKPLDGNYLVVPVAACRALGRSFGMTPAEAEIAALASGVCPARYERNLGTIGLAGQRKLLESRAAVVGLGGLGGLLAELLARVGVGRLILVDGDEFSENNLNRQLLCREEDIGRNKAEAAFERVRAVNMALDVDVAAVFLEDEGDAHSLLMGADIVLDGLDNNKTRKIVSDYCRKASIPFVHGAIGGMWAQAGVFLPEDRTPWEAEDVPDRGVEISTGNPPFTPAFTAALQAALAVEVLTGIADVKHGVLHWFDLGNMTMQRLEM
jgi:Dinucleotide-utilizing enzymes involved in molybdopterin and thiamine biosynthesis family 2